MSKTYLHCAVPTMRNFRNVLWCWRLNEPFFGCYVDNAGMRRPEDQAATTAWPYCSYCRQWIDPAELLADDEAAHTFMFSIDKPREAR